MPKKKWIKPKLIVLVRGRPEESVLAGCKHATHGRYGGISYNSHCEAGSRFGCNECSANGGST